MNFICAVYQLPPRVVGLNPQSGGGVLVDSSYAAEVRIAWQKAVGGLISDLNELYTELLHRLYPGSEMYQVVVRAPNNETLSESEKAVRDKRVRDNLAAGLYGDPQSNEALAMAQSEMGIDTE